MQYLFEIVLLHDIFTGRNPKQNLISKHNVTYMFQMEEEVIMT